MILSHKICLQPNAVQERHFRRASGVARFAYNWALAEWKRQYEAGDKPSEASLRRQLNAVKREQFPWMLEVSKTAPQQAIKNLGTAYGNFFRDLKKSGGKRAKPPRFKKKGQHDSFRADNGPNSFKLKGKRIQLPRIGWVRMREELRLSGSIKSAVVSRIADRWYVSILVELEDFNTCRESQAAVGVDLGLKALATLSDGTVIEGPKALRSNLARLRRLSRSLSRKLKGSSNRKKAAMKVARLHAHISNIRKDSLHKLTTSLTERHCVIGIEDLNVQGMQKNRNLARAVADMGFHEFRRQLEYKAAMRGCRVVVASRWFPSSKTCSACGCVAASMPLTLRAWSCRDCGSEHDRDLNAAINLKNLAASYAVTACGEERSGAAGISRVKRASMKQEPTMQTRL